MALMNNYFRPFLDKFVLVFLDDILIYSKTREEHFHHLRTVLETLRKHKMYGKKDKCDFLKTSVEYLGHRISEKGLEVCQDKVEKVLQ